MARKQTHHGIYSLKERQYIELPPRLRKPVTWGSDDGPVNLWACTDAVPAMLEIYRGLVTNGQNVRLQPISKDDITLMRAGLYPD